MAVNIFDKYGIKEVANVYFEALEDDINAGVYKGDIVLYLDSLKVSTIETTAQNTAAQGGWGNPKLVQWDYGKEINITLEDALMSLESLRFMLGGQIKRANSNDSVWVQRTEEVIADANGYIPLPVDHLNSSVTLKPEAHVNRPIRFVNYGGGIDPTTGLPSACAGARTQIEYSTEADAVNKMTSSKYKLTFSNPRAGITDATPAPGDHIRIFWEDKVVTNDAAVEVVISPDTFPGTYKIVGDTFMRSEKTGKDEPFQFIINKAKVQSNVTLTLQAEGDPTTFSMTLNVLRSSGENGNEMMRLVRYDVGGDTDGVNEKDTGSLEAMGSNG